MIMYRSALVSLLVVALSACVFTENRSVAVLPEHLVCRNDADCTEVPLACASCGDIVAREFAASLVAERRRICKRYRGPIVDCNPSPGVMCRSGTCVSKPYSWQSGQ